METFADYLLKETDLVNKMDILINDEVNEIRFITFKSLVINDML